jgi:hypothetical protein
LEASFLDSLQKQVLTTINYLQREQVFGIVMHLRLSAAVQTEKEERIHPKKNKRGGKKKPNPQFVPLFQYMWDSQGIRDSVGWLQVMVQAPYDKKHRHTRERERERERSFIEK